MSTLIESLAEHPATEVVRRANLADFLARHPRALLFFTGDLGQRPEAHDVAIVVRELIKQYDGRLTLGLVDRRDETSLMAKTGVVVVPALAFMADARTVEVIARMRDWSSYVEAAARLFEGAEPPA